MIKTNKALHSDKHGKAVRRVNYQSILCANRHRHVAPSG